MRFPTSPPAPPAPVEEAVDTYELNFDDGSQPSTPAPPPQPAAPTAPPEPAPLQPADDGLPELSALEPADDNAAFLPDLQPATEEAAPALCPSCSSQVRPGAVICVQCGFNLKDGKKLETTVGKAVSKGAGAPGGGGRFSNSRYEPVYDGFFGRLSRSWEFAKISYGIIWNYKRLLVFPILSGVAAVLVLISFAVPIFAWGVFDTVNEQADTTQTAMVEQNEQSTESESVDQSAQTSQETITEPVMPDTTGMTEDEAFAAEQKYIADSEAYWESQEASSEFAYDADSEPMHPVMYVVIFAYYFCNYFVIVFFNTALIACAMKVASGEVPTVGYGLKIAMKRLPQIVAWAAVSAVVGLILQIIENANEKVGKIIAMIIGSAWTILTYFVVPVLAIEGIGPFKAIKQSVKTLQDTWGEAVLGNFSLGWLSFLLAIPVYAVLFGLFLLAASMESGVLIGCVVVLGILAAIVLAASGSAADIVFKALLYNYATGRDMPADIDQDNFAAAFAAKAT